MSRHESETATYLGTLDCVHCGLCVESCPTYRVTGRESANPRGRVYMMRALLEDRVEPSDDLVADLDLCLVCRACETACPSGVRFGEVITEVRAKLRKRSRIRRWLMDRVLPDRRRLARLAALMRFYQRSGVRVVRHLLPARLRAMEAYMPSIPPRSERQRLPALSPAAGSSLGRVGFLEGCIMPVLFGAVNRDTVKLLNAAGYDVVVPEGAECCGALHEHDGNLERARELGRANVRAFRNADVTALVTNSAGCGAALAGYPHLMAGEEGAAALPPSTDVMRFLSDHGGLLRFRQRRARVTYDAPCHLHHAQGETQAPLDMIRRIEGVEVIPLPDAERCCGAAGVYNLDEPETSAAILEPKLDALARTGAEILLTGNPGCMMQWQAGIARRGLRIDVMHPVSFLASSLA